MLSGFPIDRRTVVLGGVSLPLIGCDQQGRSSGDEIFPGNSNSNGVDRLHEVLATIEIVAGATALVGVLFGFPQVALVAQRIGQLTAFADQFRGFLLERNLVTSLPALDGPHSSSMLDWIIPPAHAESYNANGSSSEGRAPNPLTGVSFLTGQTTINVSCRNTGNSAFETHNVYTVIRPIDQPAPSLPEDLTGPDSLPTYSVSLPVGETYQNPTVIERPVAQGYVVYTWCVPSQDQLTPAILASQLMLGPVFYNCDPNDYALIEAIQEARQSSAPNAVGYNYADPASSGS